MVTTLGNSSVQCLASWHLRDEIEKVIKFVSGKSPHRTNNEFSVDVAFAFQHPVNLAHRYVHSPG